MSSFAPGLTPSQLNSAEPAQWRQFIRQSQDDLRCATPAFLVKDVDVVTQTVTVQIAIQERVRPASGPAQWWDIPPIINVPIIVPRGGGYSITLPLKKGDKGILIFCDTCFDNWWQNGTTGSPPAYTSKTTQAVSGSQRQFEVRRHYVHDCGFLPGMWTQKDLLLNYSADSLQIRTDDGTTTVIDVSQDGVVISAGSTTAVDVGPTAASVTADAITLTSPLSPAGSLVVGTLFELPGVVVPTTGAATFFIPVTIGGVAYKLLLQAV